MEHQDILNHMKKELNYSKEKCHKYQTIGSLSKKITPEQFFKSMKKIGFKKDKNWGEEVCTEEGSFYSVYNKEYGCFGFGEKSRLLESFEYFEEYRSLPGYN